MIQITLLRFNGLPPSAVRCVFLRGPSLSDSSTTPSLEIAGVLGRLAGPVLRIYFKPVTLRAQLPL